MLDMQQRTGEIGSFQYLGRLVCSLEKLLVCVVVLCGAARAQKQISGSQDALKPSKNQTGYQTASPEELTPLFRDNAATAWLSSHRVRSYGWVDGGYSYASSGDGLLGVAPSPTRFGNEFLLNGAWLIVERPADKESLSWGFRSDFYGGSDAALLRPMNNFGPQGKHMGTDFRQLYLSVYIPAKRSLDLQLGRQNMPLGYETLMAPYRPLYSQTYFWINFQVAATAAIATWHPASSLDVTGGVVAGYNTVFEMRGRAPDYISRVTYRPNRSRNLSFLATVFTGPRPAPIAAGHTDSWQTVLDTEARYNWHSRVQQIVQFDSSWSAADKKNNGNTSATYGASTMTVFHLDKKFDLNARGEWFYDKQGVHTSRPGSFGEATLGVAYSPSRWLTFRPEIRGDFAGQPSFGPVGATSYSRNQLTVAGDMIFKFAAIR